MAEVHVEKGDDVVATRGRCPRSPLDDPASRGQAGLRGAVCPPTTRSAKNKNWNHPLAESRTWGLIGVRYLFASLGRVAPRTGLHPIGPRREMLLPAPEPAIDTSQRALGCSTV